MLATASAAGRPRTGNGSIAGLTNIPAPSPRPNDRTLPPCRLATTASALLSVGLNRPTPAALGPAPVAYSPDSANDVPLNTIDLGDTLRFIVNDNLAGDQQVGELVAH